MYVLFYLVRDGTSFLSFHYDGKRVVGLINLRALEGREQITNRNKLNLEGN